MHDPLCGSRCIVAGQVDVRIVALRKRDCRSFHCDNLISDSPLSSCHDVLVMGSMMFSWEVFLLREVTEDWGRLRRPVRPQLDLAVMVAELVVLPPRALAGRWESPQRLHCLREDRERRMAMEAQVVVTIVSGIEMVPDLAGALLLRRILEMIWSLYYND